MEEWAHAGPDGADASRPDRTEGEVGANPPVLLFLEREPQLLRP